MKSEQSDDGESASLRRSAEERLKFEKPNPQAEVDTMRLLHELEVHRIELEMQNEELQKARNEAEKGLQRYTDLYDFAPVGYLTLNQDGIILQANLTVCKLLGIERSRLLNHRFTHFMAAEDVDSFNSLLTRAFESRALVIGEVNLAFEDKEPITLELQACVPEHLQECQIALMDISERKQVEQLQTANDELQSLNNAMVDRELRMIELKAEIDALCAQFGLPARYQS